MQCISKALKEYMCSGWGETDSPPFWYVDESNNNPWGQNILLAENNYDGADYLHRGLHHGVGFQEWTPHGDRYINDTTTNNYWKYCSNWDDCPILDRYSDINMILGDASWNRNILSYDDFYDFYCDREGGNMWTNKVKSFMPNRTGDHKPSNILSHWPRRSEGDSVINLFDPNLPPFWFGNPRYTGGDPIIFEGGIGNTPAWIQEDGSFYTMELYDEPGLGGLMMTEEEYQDLLVIYTECASEFTVAFVPPTPEFSIQDIDYENTISFEIKNSYTNKIVHKFASKDDNYRWDISGYKNIEGQYKLNANYQGSALVTDSTGQVSNEIIKSVSSNISEFSISPLYYISGCTDTISVNYDPTAIIDDGSCKYQTDCDEKYLKETLDFASLNTISLHPGYNIISYPYSFGNYAYNIFDVLNVSYFASGQTEPGLFSDYDTIISFYNNDYFSGMYLNGEWQLSSKGIDSIHQVVPGMGFVLKLNIGGTISWTPPRIWE
jgi:hypothetical protein